MALHIPKFHLYRMGSDPEFLFVKPADMDYIITPACVILGKDKAKNTSSFIGTDSRPVIAEIRPTPSRNLRRHMYDLAYALHTAQQYIGTKYVGTELYATPYLHGETLGGHIHVSGYLDDPAYLELAKYGYDYNVGHGVQYIGPNTPPMGSSWVQAMSNRFDGRQIVTPYTWGQIMNYLLEPFEYWVMPWLQRENRNKHYGNAQHPDIVRAGTSKAPFKKPGLHYVHWEYRLPSTWLIHPHLAYAYLALAKLTMLNFRTVGRLFANSPAFTRMSKGFSGDEEAPPQIVGPGNEPLYNFVYQKEAKNGEYFKQMQERLAEVSKEKLLLTPDIKDVFELLKICGQNRERWFGRPQPINVEEWRRLL